ncbi:MAG: hypothetical protein KDI15_06250 [Thiothrix sp.]|nr:hypothetical protein [Thiothrix sp.]HPE58872.1 hypothetical protein [Thiolinea sp.]
MKRITTGIIAASLLSILSGTSVIANTVDPLNLDELQEATRLATPATTGSTQRASRSRSNTAGTTASVELLLVERRPTDKEQPELRQADVYYYDYGTDETIHSIIDLPSQAVISTEREQYVQLPLTENEIIRTKALLFNDDEQMNLLQAEYQRITGQYLTGPEQLNVKAFTFSADTLPGPGQLNAASEQCGLHRCAQVLLYTHDSTVFEISPIVNLSAGIVTQNIGF